MKLKHVRGKHKADREATEAKAKEKLEKEGKKKALLERKIKADEVAASKQEQCQSCDTTMTAGDATSWQLRVGLHPHDPPPSRAQTSPTLYLFLSLT